MTIWQLIWKNIVDLFPNPRRKAALRELEARRLSDRVAEGLRSGEITDCGR